MTTKEAINKAVGLKPIVFKSVDPKWPKWGVANKQFPKTMWFHTRIDAENYAKTGKIENSCCGN